MTPRSLIANIVCTIQIDTGEQW